MAYIEFIVTPNFDRTVWQVWEETIGRKELLEELEHLREAKEFAKELVHASLDAGHTSRSYLVAPAGYRQFIY